MEPPGGVPPDRDRQLVLKQMVTFHERPEGSLCGKAITTTSQANPAFASTATTYSATTQAATAFSGSSIGHALVKHHGTTQPQQQHLHHHQQQHSNSSGSSPSQHGGGGSTTSSSSSSSSTLQSATSTSSATSQQQTLEKLSRPMAFDKVKKKNIFLNLKINLLISY